MQKKLILLFFSLFTGLISANKCFFSERLLPKIKTLLLIAVFTVSSLNMFSQTSSLINNCGDFVSGPSSWPYVLIATTLDSGTVSQGAQTYTMNITSLPTGGANVRVYKTVSNGNSFFGNPVALTIGSNTITVAAVTFDRAVKFQFSSGDVEFDALSVNGVASTCVNTTPPPSTSFISTCGDFVSGPSAWPYVLVATTIADGAASQGSQTYTMNVTSLPAGGANFRVYKTTANGSSFFGNPVALTLCSNTITVSAVTFDRAVKFQFSNGDVEFDALSVNGVASTCVGSISSSVRDVVDACDSYTWIDGNTYTSSNNTATHTLINANGCDSVVTLDLTINNSTTSITTDTVCGSYTWTINGSTYTSSVVDTVIGVNAAGCIETNVLNLTINNSTTSITTDTVCGSYTWTINGSTYTSSVVDTVIGAVSYTHLTLPTICSV